MAPPNLVAQNAAGSAPLGAVTFTGVDPGVASAATGWRLLNDNSGGAVDEAVGIGVTVRQVDATDGEAKEKGLRAVDERWIEIRAVGTGSAGSNQPATDWFSVGSGRSLFLSPLGSGEYHDLQIRYNPPGTADEGQVTFLLQVDPDLRLHRVEQAHTEWGPDAILLGVEGDGLEIVRGGEPQASAPADSDINLPDLAWFHKGIPYADLEHALTINDQDGSAQTLASGEAYWAVVSLGAGTITVTKGDKATAPLDQATTPAIPDGEIFYCRVERNFGTISQGDIEEIGPVGAYELNATSGLTVTIGPGLARVDNALIRNKTESVISLDASTSNQGIWIVAEADALIVANVGKPTPRALLLHECDTDATTVTATRDRRRLGGAYLDTVAFDHSTEDVHSIWDPHGVYVEPIFSAFMQMASLGSGNLQGELRLEVEYLDNTGTWNSIFPNSGTKDTRPRFLYTDTDWVHFGYAEDLDPDMTVGLIRFSIVTVTSFDGTAPTVAAVGLRFLRS